MSLRHRPLSLLAAPVVAAALFAGLAQANQLVYVPLDQPCRLLDTRTSTGGPGPLTATHGAYLFGTSIADISSPAQHGSASGCNIPVDVAAVSVNMNLLNAPVSGNIVTWSVDAGPTAPNIGTAVYNPTVTSAGGGQVQYNTGYTTIPVGYAPTPSPGRFYLQVANGQIDMTMNIVGYWLGLSNGETRGPYTFTMGFGAKTSGVASTAIGRNTTASGTISMAMGEATAATGFAATAMGDTTTASNYASTAMGNRTHATGEASTAMGYNTDAVGKYSTAMGIATLASGEASTAIGTQTFADGDYSTAIGRNVGSDSHKGSFIYGDASSRSQVLNTANNQFVVAATGGAYFFSSCDMMGCGTGVGLAPGSGSWFSLSDRNAKTEVRSVDSREVLKKVATLPLNTWQYKTQDAKYRHMGPMAQDFYAAFQLGESDKAIDTVDADGVALAAIQGLSTELMEKDAKAAERLEALRNEKDREIMSLRAELSEQKSRVASLETIAADMAEMKAQLAALRHTSASTSVAVAMKP